MNNSAKTLINQTAIKNSWLSVNQNCCLVTTLFFLNRLKTDKECNKVDER